MKLLPGADYFRDNIAFRNDTVLGICQGLGDDLGINPNFFRVALASGIMFAPFVMIGIYLAMGVVVFASRTFVPNRVRHGAAERTSSEPAAGNDDLELPRAA
jgi:phage shock protein PspC (stress-responsive transcriptional regulator)